MNSPRQKKLKNALDKAASCSILAERSIQIVAVLREALKPLRQDPILVGGAAVEFYTQGGNP